MEDVKRAVLTSVFAMLGLLSGCMPYSETEAGDTGAQPVAEGRVSQGACSTLICNYASDCEPCPGYTASCDEGMCNYTYTGGSGGGRTPYCEPVFCSVDSDCNSYCYNTYSPQCVNSVCQP